MTENEMRRDAFSDVLALVRPDRSPAQAIAIFDRWCDDPMMARAFVAAFRAVLRNVLSGWATDDAELQRTLDALELELRDLPTEA